MTHGPRILVFDSGLGGLSVVKALREIAPDAQLAYGADNAAFPYGDWQEGALVDRMEKVMGQLVGQMQPDVVVIACNTATTIGLEAMRQRFDVPFVGTVPAIKPAANLTTTGHISVLATPGTVNREYTKALIDTYAFHCQVRLHGAENLAEMAEKKLSGQGVDHAALRAEVAPVFVADKMGRTDVVVLGCTHYPLLLDELEQVTPWPVTFIDPAPAIARQVLRVAANATDVHRPGWASKNSATLSGGVGTIPTLASLFNQFGFPNVSGLAPEGQSQPDTNRL